MTAKSANPTKSRPYGSKRGSEPGGKPQAFPVAQVEQALRRSLGNVSLTANALGCARDTIYSYLNRYPAQLAHVRAECRGEVADLAEAHLLIAVQRGEQWAVSHALKLYGRYIGIGENIDITGGGELIGPPVNVTVNFVKSRFKDSAPITQDERENHVRF